jgi:hypothetical protein
VVVAADETGFLMNPLLKKTWAPAGKTPVVAYRTRHRRKVSVPGAVTCQPSRGLFEAVCDFHPDACVRAPQAAAFIHRLLAEHPGRRIDLIGDDLDAHRSKRVKERVEQRPNLHVHHLPGYAPELNPAEMLWCLSKHHRMANHAVGDVPELHAEAERCVNEVAGEQSLLESCHTHAGLALWKPSDQ